MYATGGGGFRRSWSQSALAAVLGALLALGAIWMLSGSLALTPRSRTEALEETVADLAGRQAAFTATIEAISADLDRHDDSIVALEAAVVELAGSARRSDDFLDGLRVLLDEVDATPTRTLRPTASTEATRAAATAAYGLPRTPTPAWRAKVPRPVE